LLDSLLQESGRNNAAAQFLVVAPAWLQGAVTSHYCSVLYSLTAVYCTVLYCNDLMQYCTVERSNITL
jgi:hypothetical protein